MVATFILCGMSVAPLAGCSVPSDEWSLEPIRHDNALDGSSEQSFTDVTYPMDLSSDREGGFWGHSSGSWIHVDAEGEVTRRFNVAPDRFGPVNGFAGYSPTEVVIAIYGAVGEDGSGRLAVFDTATDTVEELAHTYFPITDVAIDDAGTIYFLERREVERTFSLMKLQKEPESAPLQLREGIRGEAAQLSVPDDGETAYVVTDVERVQVTGSHASLTGDTTAAAPRVAVSDAGLVLTSTVGAPTGAEPVNISGGSWDAGSVLKRFLSCDDSAVMLGWETPGTHLGSFCSINGIAALSDGRFVVSVGDEGGAVLAYLNPPTG